MCRISATIGRPKAYMKSGGIKTFEERDEYGVHLVHEWLPIQADPEKVESPYVRWNETDTVLFNGELFGHSMSDDMELIGSFKTLDRLKNYLRTEADGFWSMIVARTDYSGAHWSVINRDYTAIVDPLSKKQLYYKMGVGVSSEIKALLTPEDEIDEAHLARTIKWGYVNDDSTPFKSIKRVMPNTMVTFNEDFTHILKVENNYRDMSPKLLNEEQFIRKMQDSVRNRLAGHQPISLLLSGGLDSSIIRHHLDEVRGNVTSYCIDNEEDIEHAKLVDYKVETIDLKESSIEEALKIMEMPLDLGSMVPQCALVKSVKSVVILTGDGADEVFGGYRRMKTYDAQLSDVFDELPFYHHVRLDRMAAGFTKEIRSPFLHLDIVRHGLALPYEERIDKAYLRRVYANILPPEIVNRGKEPLKTAEIRQSSGEEYRAKIVHLWRGIHRRWCEEKEETLAQTS